VPVPLAGSGQAIGGGDHGSLFPPDGSVPIMPPDVGGSGSGGGATTIPGDGNEAKSTLEGNIKGSATFTQTGEDVRILVDLTSGCADGKHRFTVHTGGSCDSDATDGDPWSPRGTELGNDITCSGGKGKLDYTRSGTDKTKNLTVGDHETATDVTAHVVIVSDEKDLNSRAACGNFFF
jgi:Cu/Zn superoxide dismutase